MALAHSISIFVMTTFVLFQLMDIKLAKADCENDLKRSRKHAEAYCQLQALKKLGMRIRESSSSADPLPDAETWNPCGETLDGRDRTISCLTDGSEADFAKKIQEVFNDRRMLCMFKQGLSTALWQASHSLKKNVDSKSYEFGSGESCNGLFAVLPEEEWVASVHDKLEKSYIKGVFKPQEECPPSKAMDCFYNSKCKTECAVGQQVVQYAMMNELMGEDDFNEFFKGKVELGHFETLGKQKSENPFFKFMERSDSTKKAEDMGKTMKQVRTYGPMPLVGMSGALAGQESKTVKANSMVDINQNFVLTHFSKDAVQSWGKQDISKVMERIWILEILIDRYKQGASSSKKVPNEVKKIDIQPYEVKYLEALNKHLEQGEGGGLKSKGHWVGSGQTVKMSEANLQTLEQELLKLKSDPGLTEVNIYVHPTGEKTLVQYIDDMKRVNPALPYNFVFYPDYTNGALFEDLKAFYIQQCQRENFRANK